jgi:hypothetical protein
LQSLGKESATIMVNEAWVECLRPLANKAFHRIGQKAGLPVNLVLAVIN